MQVSLEKFDRELLEHSTLQENKDISTQTEAYVKPSKLRYGHLGTYGST